MEELFKVGNIITTNDRNALRILGVNESDICVQDLLNLDFDVLSKTEHEYKLADIKTILKISLLDIIADSPNGVPNESKDFIIEQMNCRIDKFII